MRKIQTIESEAFLSFVQNPKMYVEFTGEFKSGDLHFDQFGTNNSFDVIEPMEHRIIFDGVPIINTYFYFNLIVNDKYKSPSSYPYKEDESFVNDIKKQTENLLIEIDMNISTRHNKWEVVDYLQKLLFDLEELHTNYQQESKEVFGTLFTITSNSKVAPFYSDIEKGIFNECQVGFAISSYLFILNKTIGKVISYIKPRLKVIKKTDDYVVINSSHSDQDIKWSKSDTDLLELIVSLHESGAIQNSTKNLSQKEAIEIFCELFQKEIKDPYKKLNAARIRYKDTFMDKLADILTEYYKKQDNKIK